MSGIEKTVIRVPDIIDGVWFRRWVTEELAKADVRNATAVGMTIETDAYGRPVLTFDVSPDVAAHNVDPLAHAEAFAAHRSESDPHTQYVPKSTTTVADASGGATVDTEARAAINSLLAELRVTGAIGT